MALGQPLNIAPVLRYTHLHSTQGRVHAHHMHGCVCMDTHTHKHLQKETNGEFVPSCVNSTKD